MLSLENTHPLDFSDVAILPRLRNNEAAGQAAVSIRHPVHHCVPIATTPTHADAFSHAQENQKQHFMTVIPRTCSPEEWSAQVSERGLDARAMIPAFQFKNVATEVSRLKRILEMHPDIPFVRMDPANGYAPAVAAALKAVRAALPGVHLCAGGVLDDIGRNHLQSAGVDLIHVGIPDAENVLSAAGVGAPLFQAMLNLTNTPQAPCGLTVSMPSNNVGNLVKAFAVGADFIFLEGAHPHPLSSVADGLRLACSYLGVTELTDMKTIRMTAVRVK